MDIVARGPLETTTQQTSNSLTTDSGIPGTILSVLMANHIAISDIKTFDAFLPFSASFTPSLPPVPFPLTLPHPFSHPHLSDIFPCHSSRGRRSSVSVSRQSISVPSAAVSSRSGRFGGGTSKSAAAAAAAAAAGGGSAPFGGASTTSMSSGQDADRNTANRNADDGPSVSGTYCLIDSHLYLSICPWLDCF